MPERYTLNSGHSRTAAKVPQDLRLPGRGTRSTLPRDPVVPNVELLHRDHLRTRLSPGDAAGVQSGADRREVLGEVGLAECAGDGSAIAYHGVGDEFLRVMKDRKEADEVVAKWPDRYLAAVAGQLGPLDAVCVLTTTTSSTSPQSSDCLREGSSTLALWDHAQPTGSGSPGCAKRA
jgi:hypothetical protein